MSNGVHCRCHSCTIRGLMWPAVLITLGVLFLLDRAHVGPFYFSHTWPVVLVVMGLIQLACSVASREGHVDNTPTTVPPGVPPVAPPPPNTSTPLSPEGR
jgi:Domain of unknown function (DUF5668)